MPSSVTPRIAEAKEAGYTVSRLHLTERTPSLTTAEMLGHLVPPPQFHTADFANYLPDANYPSQSASREAAATFFDQPGGGLFRKGPERKSGLYLDGGFGVGKTHLLASAWHIAKGRKYFGTFIEYTALVGALGFSEAVKALTGAAFIAIDEFELDDPGDTMVMTRLLGELMERGTRVMATSNTPPNALGEGRFAAADFLREIHALSDRFDTIRIDGVDYRHRENEGRADVASTAELDELNDAMVIADDSFGEVVRHLGTLHPSKYVPLIAGVDAIAWRDVEPFTDQNDALRFVALVDRLYDADIPIRATGTPLDEIFPDEMLSGGFRKKYLRAQSRLVALTHRATRA
jgi:cell division protein ZapE